MLGEAWHAMGSNRMRTVLTMLGMVIGVSSVVLMMAIGQGAQYAVAQTISTMGSNLYIVVSGSSNSGGVRSGSGFGPTLTAGDAQAIAELDDITQVAPIHQGTQQLIYGAKNWSATVVGTTPSYLDARAWALTSGYTFSDTDVRSASRVALIGKTAAGNLFAPDEDPVGKTIRIRQTPFTIIGTLAPKGQNLDGRDQDDDFFIRNLAAAADSAAETTHVMSLLLGGIGGALLVDALSEMVIVISGDAVLVAFAVAAGVGVFFRIYPARKAAALDPIEALRHQ